jgi:hypothetical protein
MNVGPMHNCVISFRERRMFSYLTEHAPFSSHLTLFTHPGVPVPAIRSEEKIDKQNVAWQTQTTGRSRDPKVGFLLSATHVVCIMYVCRTGSNTKYLRVVSTVPTRTVN